MKLKRAPKFSDLENQGRAYRVLLPEGMHDTSDFDSINGQSNNETVFVTYNAGMARAYPRYIVTYTSAYK